MSRALDQRDPQVAQAPAEHRLPYFEIGRVRLPVGCEVPVYQRE